jgi:mannosyl-3-phosphoglycerate phosphatase
MENMEYKSIFERMIIFTDLDGTLLDYENYSYSDASPALKFINDKKIPLVFCTSKTRVEVETLQKEIGVNNPFIVENGSAIFIPKEHHIHEIDGSTDAGDYWQIILGVNYQTIRSFIKNIDKQFKVKGFGDMNVKDISKLTGLSVEKAAMAKLREFTEPFVISDPKNIPEIKKSALFYDIAVTKSGRFYHFIGNNSNKGVAVTRLRNIYSRLTKQEMLTIGLGDSTNDFPMLISVDIPVLIPNSDGSYADLDLPGIIRAAFPGSKGWNNTILSLLATFSDKNDDNSS